MSNLDAISTLTELRLLVAFTDLTQFARYGQSCSARELFDTISSECEITCSIVDDALRKGEKLIGDTALIVFRDEDCDYGVDALLSIKKQMINGCRSVISHVVTAFGTTVNPTATLAS